MNHCKKPCSDCPFRKNSLPGWLGDYENAQDLHNLVMTQEAPFPCHLTHEDEDISFTEAGNEDHPLCAGALLYMRKAFKLPRNKVIAEISKSLDIKEMENILSVPEFFKHHE